MWILHSEDYMDYKEGRTDSPPPSSRTAASKQATRTSISSAGASESHHPTSVIVSSPVEKLVVVVQDSFLDTTEKIRLPTIELPKFSGNLIDWLTFWAQFEKIHLDIRLKDSDKFYYLLQSLSVDTEAYKIVSIYPLTEENYSKAIDALRRRYANPDLLLQVYVRELLKLVIDSASGKKKLSFHELYYKLQSYLGSLKSLNLESAGPDTWLYPLVESCLSDELLLTWQRRSQFIKLDVEHQTRLDQLMDFLEREILIQQNIQLAKGGFQIAETSDQERKKGFNKKKNDIPTVTGLQQTELGGCIFCEKKHASQNCFAAKKMSLEEKRKVIREKKVCFKCLKGRHLARYCRTRVRVENEEIQVSFMSAKTRVTPMKREILKKNKKTGESEMIVKEISIPRLEFLACLIGSRLLSTVKGSLNITDIKEFYWTDSTAVLAWIKREEIWNTFVGNRIREIRELTLPNNWRHIQGTRNPADLPSRGCSPSQLLQSKWWEGPNWLYERENKWPISTEMIDEIQVNKERKKSSVEINQDSLLINFNVIQEVRYDYTYSQYVRILGWILRFIYNLRNNEKPFGRLLPEELKMAELQLIRSVQVETFSNPDNLRGYQIKRSEDGILRVKTRLTFREDLEDYKSPILLPRKHPLVKKLIEEYHLKFCHAGVLFLMNELGEKYWILQSRIAVKRVVRQCVTCRKLTAKSVITEEAPLPKERIMTTNVFEIIGVDLTGPLYLKGQAKVWTVIYTCSVYRAIDWKKLQESDCVKPIQWRFNPPFAAWWGGWWERLIRSMKNLLKRTLGKATLRKEQLVKMLEEVQSIMNGRPLTYISEEMEDPQPLTPAMFLRHKGNIKFPEGDLTEKDRLQFSYAWRKSLERELKNRFRSEYLSHLINKNKGKNSHNLRIGDIVVIGSDLRKRTEWPLGRIIELYPGKDGIVRVAKLKTGGGIVIRPVQRLCPMELDFSEEFSNRFQDSVEC
ncbi:hypothetical protein LAZ67_12002471 [Cordylochernes scorpioides]|uniref:Integrase catalytic domain-containing protein n=1 Tax=Cordylochernes scorpioides TaxID=51811 RepID=A0ABY6L1T1_9ARAC|nr:hypothetical protein LAZ67_12002471 [Cordylochernes scorpioides]